VQSGDSIGEIAQQYRTSISVIKRVNDMDSNTIYIGDYLLVPVATTDAEASMLNHPQMARTVTNAGQQKTTHTIASGDTLSEIAQMHNVSVRDLTRWNNITSRTTLQIGAQLAIYTDMPTVTTDKTRTITYRVRNGDSLSRIASKFNVSINDIVRWNTLNRQKYLQPGQRLRLTIDLTKS
jgi:membrane-bound lytic murein transglycosylase D